MGGKSNASVQDKDSSYFSKKEVEEETSDGGGTSFKATAKVLKIGLIAMVPILIVVIFMNLIVAGTQTFLKVVGLGQADEASSVEVESAIRDNGTKDLDEEITDENVDKGNSGDLTGYIYDGDLFIENYSTNKLSKLNFIANETSRKYNEADLKELEDYYHDINNYKAQNYDMDEVYRFYFKLYYIQKRYEKDYYVSLDIPLIMSTLYIESEDMSEVFISNTKGYKVYNDTDKNINYEYFSYSQDWSNHKLSKNDSSHDIEILAQNMVSTITNSSCNGTVDGACYKIDQDKYREFLKEFLEKKYFINESGVNNMITQIYDAKEQYEDLVGDYTNEPIVIPVSNNLYWWPIGSKETEDINGVLYAKGEPQVIGTTSQYGGTDGFRIIEHGGIDIGNGGYGIGVINIIAAKSGEVVYPTNDSQTQYNDNGYYRNPDGGGYGNYVKIKHSDGSYTIYAHLAKNSITVRAGDVVAQGQVIGKMGHSGSSTGAHLHFEIRIGTDAKEGRVNPLEYVAPENPRPMSYGGGFSITTTTLSKEEFVAKMIDYYNRTKKEGFYKNFVVNAEEVYDTSLANNVNPELVVVTAGTEQNWTLSAACQYTNNYWGIGITNGKGCNSGGKYDSLSEGIAAYAKLLNAYSDYGSYAEMITNRYNERSQAGCDSGGHGLPGTLQGMQSIYSSIGTYRYNPGSWGLGGCKYLNIIYGENYCSTVSTCAGSSNCPVESKTTVCEQNDYTAWQVKGKISMRYDIFGL